MRMVFSYFMNDTLSVEVYANTFKTKTFVNNADFIIAHFFLNLSKNVTVGTH